MTGCCSKATGPAVNTEKLPSWGQGNILSLHLRALCNACLWSLSVAVCLQKLYMHLEVFIAKKKKDQAALKEQLNCIKLYVTGLNARLGGENKKRPGMLFILYTI